MAKKYWRMAKNNSRHGADLVSLWFTGGSLWFIVIYVWFAATCLWFIGSATRRKIIPYAKKIFFLREAVPVTHRDSTVSYRLVALTHRGSTVSYRLVALNYRDVVKTVRGAIINYGGVAKNALFNAWRGWAMIYNNHNVRVLGVKNVFTREVAVVFDAVTREVLTVPRAALSDDVLNKDGIRFSALAARLDNDIKNKTLIAPFESNIIPLPHQIFALEKVMAGGEYRCLLADEVGMGKTIEAALILKELLRKGAVKRVLIISPVGAMKQWQDEMLLKFNERFDIYDARYLKTLDAISDTLGGESINPFDKSNKIIISLDTLRANSEVGKGRLESACCASIDLLIIDECHKVGGSNENIGRFIMARELCNSIPYVLLLSATPHRGKSDHFIRLMRLLNEDAFRGDAAFNKDVLTRYIVRSVKRQAIDYDGKRLFRARKTQCLLVHYDKDEHRRQLSLYKSVSDYVKTGFNRAKCTKNNSYGFVMVLFQRMASSSTTAICGALRNRIAKLESQKDADCKKMADEPLIDIDESEVSESLITAVSKVYDSEIDDLKALYEEARQCIIYEEDAKFQALLTLMDNIKRAENDYAMKFIIFTEFTLTQNMLFEKLGDYGGYNCAVINGSQGLEERCALLNTFKGDVQVLISTDAAGESLNMQFSHVVINYDLPWNPMVIEQRVGRVDRIGQKNEVLAINMMGENSIDRRVYEVIETKLGNIMRDMGFDKTCDVLDSTIDIKGVDALYKTCITNGDDFEKESTRLLNEAKERLACYKENQNIIPVTRDCDIDIQKAQDHKNSPLSAWVKMLQGLYNKIHGTDVIKGDISLSSEWVGKMISEIPTFYSGCDIPIVEISDRKNVSGIFAILKISAQNSYKKIQRYESVFLSDGDKYFPTYAKALWEELSLMECDFKITGSLKGDEAKESFLRLDSVIQERLGDVFSKMECNLLSDSDIMKGDKDSSYASLRVRAGKIGLATVKNYRLKKCKESYNEWVADFDNKKQVAPDLEYILILRVSARG